MKYLILLLILILISGCVTQENQNQSNIETQVISNELNQPWAIDFINENQVLITQKEGDLILLNINSGEKQSIANVPIVTSSGQGGLMDVEYENKSIYLTYTAGDEKTATHLGRGELNGGVLENFEILKVIEPYEKSNKHFGSRILIENQYLYLTTGDRGDKDFSINHVSQNLSNDLGKIHRIYKNGSIPQNNPFSNSSIYSYGHRNVQGITQNSQTGNIWVSEHGEQDGDTIKILEKGANYGWPIAHYGCRYITGRPIGEQPDQNPNITNPQHYWECGSGGFAPSGMMIYKGDKFNWENNLFVGNLADQYLGRFTINDDNSLKEHKPLLEGKRIRDVVQSPDGFIYAISDRGELIKFI